MNLACIARRVLLLAAALLLAACARAPEDPLLAGLEPQVVVETAPLAVYVSLEDLKSVAGDDASALAWMIRLSRARGVSWLAIQTKGARGEAAFASTRAAVVDREGAQALERVLRLRSLAGLSVMAAHPVFLGAPLPGEEPVSWRQAQATDEQPAEDAALAEGRLNPAVELVRLRELEVLADLAALDVDAILLTHVGFSGPSFDVSGDARLMVEAIQGRTMVNWPAVVLAEHDGRVLRGAAWAAWTRWRAELLRDFLRDARESVATGAALAAGAARGRTAPPMMVLLNGHYPLHFYEGLNWAAASARVERLWSDAPQGYAETSAAASLDGAVLLFSAPVATLAQAQQQGLAWWASIEGAREVARLALPDSVPAWSAIALTPYLDEAGELHEAQRAVLFEATAQAAAGAAGVLLLDYRLAESTGAWDDVRAGLLEARARQPLPEQ